MYLYLNRFFIPLKMAKRGGGLKGTFFDKVTVSENEAKIEEILKI